MHSVLERPRRIYRILVHRDGGEGPGLDLIIAAAVAAAIMIAILSMPEVLLPLAQRILDVFGGYAPLAVLIIGVVHGLKPDEHTWPITISYAMMQRDVGGAVLSTMTFAGALTLVWTALSAAVGLLPSSMFQGAYDWLVDVVVGVTMISIAGLYLHKERAEEGKAPAAPDYKAIWIHGLAAAFGGDFFAVLLLALSVKALSPSFPLALVGFLFGAGSFVGQIGVVLAAYKGLLKAVRAPEILVRAGRLSLLILGFFLSGLGIYTWYI